MKLAIIGAGGFLGQEIIRQAWSHPQIDRLILIDRVVLAADAPHVDCHAGDIRDARVLAPALEADAVIHLAATLGGAAEADPATAKEVNIDVPLALIDGLKGRGARLVFASSIAALGPDLPDPVTDATPLAPTMLYGAHKAMIELALSQATRRGWVDGISLRPSGLMARDGVDGGLKSAFLSQVFWAVRRGEDFVLPVAPTDRTWIASVGVTARNFLQAALAPDLGPDRALTLPALAPTFADLVAALHAAFPASGATVTYNPDPETSQLFGRFPALETPAAEAAGFSRDKNLNTLIQDAMTETTHEARHPA